MDSGLTAPSWTVRGMAPRYSLGQRVVRGLAFVGNTVSTGGRIIFSRSRNAWNMLYARTRFDYKADIGDPMDSSIVSALVGWICRNFPEAPVVIYRVSSDGTQVAVLPGPTGAGYMLRLLERPNGWFSGVTQWKALLADYMIGNAYLMKVRNAQGRVSQLWWMPAALVEPRWDEEDPTSFITHYEYKVNGTTYGLLPDDVIHFRNGLDPRNPRKGLSRLGSLYRELFTDQEAAALTASLMRNLGVPGVVIAPANTNSGPIRYDADGIKKKFDETFGGDGRGGTMVLTRPTEVKVLSWSPEQMNLRELRRIPEERAAAVIGIPAGVAQLGAGLDRNTFTNYGEANVAAYTQGVIPLQREIAAELEVQLLGEFENIEDQEWDVRFDWMKVAAMATFVADVWRRYSDAATRGLVKRSDFKRAVGLPVEPDGSDEVYIMANNFTASPARGQQPTSGGTPLLPAPGQGQALLPMGPAN